jgi:hypothetical protein
MNRPILLFPLAMFALAAADPPKTPPKAKQNPAAVAQPAKESLDEDELIQMRATPYQPKLERDPFKSPTEAGTEFMRPDMVEDIAVKGRIFSGGKILAVVVDSRGNVRWLPIGHRFKDGEIASIDDKSVTFHQWDPAASSRHFKTIVKTFKREEGKR